MILLLDIGNTNTHLGLANAHRVVRRADVPTTVWFDGRAGAKLARFVGRAAPDGAVACSVVPRATPLARRFVAQHWKVPWLELTAHTVRGLDFDYPRPETVGPDRLANAVAARHRFGAPCVTIDFGTAVTLDVVDKAGRFIGGIIAPGLALMTRYLHEQTALLPEIELRRVQRAIGRNTEEAMRIGAMHGFRGLVKELLAGVKRELCVRRLPVVATGGYANLVARDLPGITAVEPLLTLEGLRLTWLEHLPLATKDLPPKLRHA